MDRRVASILMVILLLITSVASAGGLFPSMDEMFGIALPSVGLVIGRSADGQTETDTGSQEVYRNFSEDDYSAFGQYLAGVGASIKEYSFRNGIMTAVISARDAEMIFSYDWANKTATAEYPSGTRAETEPETAEKGDSILPPVGGVMPSAEFAIDRKSDEQLTSEEGLIQSWDMFSDEDYTLFSAYLAKAGAELKNCNIDGGILNAEIGLNGFSFCFIYNWNNQSAKAIYPEGTTPESSCWNTLGGNGYILPEIKELGRELPRLSNAIEREPSSIDTLEDGSLRETYFNFNVEDYNTFSQYLQRKDCTLDNYYVDEAGVMVINLSNRSGKMIFSYDALHHTGITKYPYHSRIEPPNPIQTLGYGLKARDGSAIDFALHSGVTFGMTRDQVAKAEKEKGFEVKEDKLTYLYYNDEGKYTGWRTIGFHIMGSMAGFPGSSLYYYFDEKGKLFSAVYRFGEHDVSAYNEIESLLDNKYSSMKADTNYIIASNIDYFYNEEITNAKIYRYSKYQIELQDRSRIQITHSLMYPGLSEYDEETNLLFGGQHFLEYHFSTIEEIESVNGIVEKREQIDESIQQLQEEEQERERQEDI